MINKERAVAKSSSKLRRCSSSKLRLVVPVLALVTTFASLACQSGTGTSGSSGDPRGIIIVNAPATGEVRRIVAREGMTVAEGQPIVEIAVQEEGPAATPSPGESAEARAVRNFKAADAEIEAARAEAVRHEAEVQRLTPLVASGEASQAQLEGERALYERAQQRLQKAQDTKRSAETGLLASRQPGPQQNQGSTAGPPAPRERIVTANASSAGTVSVISARPGQKVTSGQPLATLRADQR
jgi:multidrug efflux pump subunit AcrA (membrane-fusion protein)